MAELVQRTGVPRTTVLFYLREGLLPPAEKPYPNQALYGAAHVERLLLIKEVQQAYHFPLAKIRRLVEMVDRGASPAAVARLNERLFAARAAAPADGKWSLAELCAEAGLPAETVRQALDMQILNPLTTEPDPVFDASDMEIAHVLGAGERHGMTLRDLQFMVDAARTIAAGEMALRKRLVAGRPVAEDIELTTELTDMARTLHTYIVDRMFIAIASLQAVGGVASVDSTGPERLTDRPAPDQEEEP